jgi:hypothetical protein
MTSGKKQIGSRRVTFHKDDFVQFAHKMKAWGKSLTPEEQALLITVIERGSQGILAAGDGVTQKTMALEVAPAEFNLGQVIVEILLAIEGIVAEVGEDGPSWIQEITATTKT